MPDDKTDPDFGSADREPTDDEAAAAEKNDVSDETAEHFQEMSKIGAAAEGEGKID